MAVAHRRNIWVPIKRIIKFSFCLPPHFLFLVLMREWGSITPKERVFTFMFLWESFKKLECLSSQFQWKLWGRKIFLNHFHLHSPNKFSISVTLSWHSREITVTNIGVMGTHYRLMKNLVVWRLNNNDNHRPKVVLRFAARSHFRTILTWKL